MFSNVCYKTMFERVSKLWLLSLAVKSFVSDAFLLVVPFFSYIVYCCSCSSCSRSLILSVYKYLSHLFVHCFLFGELSYVVSKLCLQHLESFVYDV